jgi:hypothetical protein
MAPISITECKPRRRIGFGAGVLVLTGASVAIWAIVIALFLWL